MIGTLSIDTIVLAAFLAFCRIGACFMLLPGFGSVRVAMQVRLFVTIAITWALLLHLWDDLVPVVDRSAAGLLILIAAELLVGAVIGLIVRFYVLALQFMAAVVAMSSGFNAMVGTAVEEPDPQTPLAALITTASLLVLFAADFHHEVVRALVASYEVVPPAAIFDAGGALADLTDTLSDAFYIMLRLASPFIAYGILVNLATGFINKLAQQIPVYFIAMPFLLFGAIIMIYFGISTMLSLFADGFLPTTLGR